MVTLKGLSYALNNPCKEVMYIPTSKDAKFKTKSFIDMFGSRSAKMSGAQIGGWLNIDGNPILSVHNLIIYLKNMNFIPTEDAIILNAEQKNDRIYNNFLSLDDLLGSKDTVNNLDTLSQLAVVAPASFAAFSICFLHIPQLPATLMVVGF